MAEGIGGRPCNGEQHHRGSRCQRGLDQRVEELDAIGMPHGNATSHVVRHFAELGLDTGRAEMAMVAGPAGGIRMRRMSPENQGKHRQQRERVPDGLPSLDNGLSEPHLPPAFSHQQHSLFGPLTSKGQATIYGSIGKFPTPRFILSLLG